MRRDKMNTILFDLDGTLLPLDMEEFTKAYFSELCKKLAPKLDPQTLPKLVWASTDYMIKNLDKDKTNMESFFEDFQKRIDVKVEDLMPTFHEFYKIDFRKLKDVVKPNPMIKEMIKSLKDKGYDLVIATNPLFPKDAIYHRVEWAGLDVNDFKLITTYENMHFCKPNLEYYNEILDIINRNSREVMMVGNDVQEDMVAGKLGIKTFLLTDYIIDRENTSFKEYSSGNMNDLLELVNVLPKL